MADTYDNRLQSQIRLSRILSSCSPYAVFTDVAAALASTNGESQIAFLKMTRRYEDDYFDNQYREGLRIGRGIHRYDPVSDAPPFRPTVPELRERMRQSFLEMGLLVFFGILYFMLGYLLFLRRPV